MEIKWSCPFWVRPEQCKYSRSGEEIVGVPILGTPTLMGESGSGHFDHKQNSETIRVFVK